jgi:hypothetical protein
MSGIHHYETFAEECTRLSQKQVSQRDKKVLLLMAQAWLLLAEHVFIPAEEDTSPLAQTPDLQ